LELNKLTNLSAQIDIEFWLGFACIIPICRNLIYDLTLDGVKSYFLGAFVLHWLEY